MSVWLWKTWHEKYCYSKTLWIYLKCGESGLILVLQEIMFTNILIGKSSDSFLYWRWCLFVCEELNFSYMEVHWGLLLSLPPYFLLCRIMQKGIDLFCFCFYHNRYIQHSPPDSNVHVIYCECVRIMQHMFQLDHSVVCCAATMCRWWGSFLCSLGLSLGQSAFANVATCTCRKCQTVATWMNKQRQIWLVNVINVKCTQSSSRFYLNFTTWASK